MFHRLAFWKTKGMNPQVIYDIGANHGGWTAQSRQVFPMAYYEQFEANKHHSAPGRHMVLLGETETDVTFYKSISDMANTGASVYLETSQHFTPGKYVTETLPMVPLDAYVVRNGLRQPDMLKLDVQGAELDVLRGGEATLRAAKYVLMEVSLHRWNKDAPMIEEVIRFMDDRGFCLVDIVEIHMVANYMLQVDALFAHKSTGLRKEEFSAH
jgi:FkbM family methyltransferase